VFIEEMLPRNVPLSFRP